MQTAHGKKLKIGTEGRLTIEPQTFCGLKEIERNQGKEIKEQLQKLEAYYCRITLTPTKF